MPNSRARLAVALAFVVGVAGGVVGVGVWTSQFERTTPESRQEQAQTLIGGVTVQPTVQVATLFAAPAYADFGPKAGGLRRVTVRILRRLDLTVELSADRDIAFGTLPTVCLVGPDSAPDDAGIESPCWGQPDLSDFLGSRLSTDDFGHPLLRAAEPLQFSATLWRSSTRCDYAPGDWSLRVSGDVIVDGHHAGFMSAPPAAFRVEIPSPETPLHLVDPDDSRYCGLASRVYLEQGEPQLEATDL